MVWHATKLPTVQSLPIHAKIIAQNALLRKESEPRKMQRQLNNSAVPSKAAAAVAAERWRCITPHRRGDRGHDVEQATQGKERPFFSKEENKKELIRVIIDVAQASFANGCLALETHVFTYIGSDNESKPYYCNDVHLQIHSICLYVHNESKEKSSNYTVSENLWF